MNMGFLSLILLLFTQISFAGLNEIRVKNLTGDYSAPKGSGDFEKINIDLSFHAPKYPFEINRTEAGYLLSTGMADLLWTKPPTFIHEADGLSVRGLDLKLGRGQHEVSAPYLSFTLKESGLTGLDRVKLRCQGKNKNSDLLFEVMEDCLSEMIFTSERVKVPESFILLDFFRKIYGIQSLPANDLDDLLLTSREGDFYLYFRTTYYVRAGFRAWGKADFDAKEEILTLKINLVKFGIFPVTSLVMDEIKKKFEDSEDVIVEPPYIKINLKQNETRTR